MKQRIRKTDDGVFYCAIVMIRQCRFRLFLCEPCEQSNGHRKVRQEVATDAE
jgi:hypothetical protein